MKKSSAFVTALVALAVSLPALALEKGADGFFMTGGGPGDVSTTLTWDIYRRSFVNRDLGSGSAVGWLLVILTFIITTIYFLLLFGNERRRKREGAS